MVISAFSKLSLAPMIFQLIVCVGVRMADYSRRVNIEEIEHEEPAAVSVQPPANGFKKIKRFKELLDKALLPRRNLKLRKSSSWDCNIGALGSGQGAAPFCCPPGEHPSLTLPPGSNIINSRKFLKNPKSGNFFRIG